MELQRTSVRLSLLPHLSSVVSVFQSEWDVFPCLFQEKRWSMLEVVTLGGKQSKVVTSLQAFLAEGKVYAARNPTHSMLHFFKFFLYPFRMFYLNFPENSLKVYFTVLLSCKDIR